MSVWTTKALNKECNYVVIKHTLKGINYSVKGVKFRDGYAVVEKDSKVYFDLKKIPVLKNFQEFPLTHLRKLKFVTRALDVKTVYGQDVYRKYIEALSAEIKKEQEAKKIIEEKTHIEESAKCTFRSEQTDQLCDIVALPGSPSKYCKRHILLDPKLNELGIEVPKFMTKKEKAELRDKISDKLR